LVVGEKFEERFKLCFVSYVRSKEILKLDFCLFSCSLVFCLLIRGLLFGFWFFNFSEFVDEGDEGYEWIWWIF